MYILDKTYWVKKLWYKVDDIRAHLTQIAPKSKKKINPTRGGHHIFFGPNHQIPREILLLFDMSHHF